MTTKRLVNGIEIDIQSRYGQDSPTVSIYKLGCGGSMTWFTRSELDRFIGELQAARDEATKVMAAAGKTW